MAGLTNKTPAQTYKDLLTVHTESNANEGLEATVKPIEDGEGFNQPYRLAQ